MVVCYCAHLTSIATTTRVVILQHPRERDRAIGTAHMASLCLPSSELHVGARWGDAELARVHSDPTRPAVLLYPGEGAVDIVEHPPLTPVTLVVVDGTWSQTKNVLRDNPALAALPRVAFTPGSPSEYRIRKEPRAECVSTIEALVHVLAALEPEPERFGAMLAPFRAMIDLQIACERTLHGARVRKKRRKAPMSDRDRLPARLVERKDDLVCVVGEANAWPYGTSGRTAHADELVHWTACRVATGETFDFVAAPRNPLAPSTPSHTRLAPEQLSAGGSVAELFARWRAFLRDSDVVCAWGHYAPALFREEGGALPGAPIDLRDAARRLVESKVGTLEDFSERVGARPGACAISGRAGDRLARLVAIAEHLRAIAE
jgi:DTW domain-containing protein YfiP